MGFTIKMLCVGIAAVVLISTACHKEQDEMLFADIPLVPIFDTNRESQSPASADDGTFAPQVLGIVPGADISEIRFTWYSDGTSSSPAIRLYDESGALVTGKDSCWARNAVAGFNQSNPNKRSNKCVLRGLARDTRYKYAVSHNGNDWSFRYEYKTSAGGNRFRFAAISDPQIDIDSAVATETRWRNVMSQIATRGVDFVACAGDQVDDYMGNENEYAIFFSPPELRNIALAPAMGNHESNNVFHNHFNLPNAKTPSSSAFPIDYAAANYWFLYNNILFVVPNTGQTPMTRLEAANNVARYDSLIATAKAASAGKYDWLIVKHHRSTRSVGPHAALTSDEFPDTTLHHIKDAGFEAVMDKHGVDLVIAGHEHLYTRTHPLRDNRIVATGQGTVYLTLLPAGSTKYYPHQTTVADWEARVYPSRSSNWWSNTFRQSGYAIFDVNGGTLAMTVYNTSGTVVDELTLTKGSSAVLEMERVIPDRF